VIRTVDARAVVLDIEGTISSLAFVKQELFPFARHHLAAYVGAHEAAVAGILDQVRSAEGAAELDTQQVIAALLRWMDEDRKSAPLKTLQGMIWRQGFDSGELRGHFYDDAVRAIRHWHQRGVQIHIYSSGSVEAQRLLFSHSAYGDLTPLIAGHFDTTTGSKLDSRSYRAIASSIGQPPTAILFLSDHPSEIEAASAAGLQAILVNREAGSKVDPGAGTISSFDDLAVAGAPEGH
jgi:enolase-phosphatase E1